MSPSTGSPRVLSFKVGDRVMTTDRAVGFRGRRGLIVEILAGEMQYHRVEFEETLEPASAYLMARWLER